MSGLSIIVPDSTIRVISVDGGHGVTPSNASNSVGVLYPAERVDFILSWDIDGKDSLSQLVVEMDPE